MNSGIGKKLGIGFGVIVAVMTCAGGYAIYQLAKSSAILRDITEHKMTAAVAAFGVRSNFDEMVWSTKNILLRGTNRETMDKELELLNMNKERLETIWTPMLEKLMKGPDIDDYEKQLYEQFQRQYAQFNDAWTEALPVYQSQGQEAADKIMRDRGRGGLGPLLQLVRSLRETSLMQMEEACSRIRTAVTVILAAFVVAMVIAVIAVIYVVRQLTAAIEAVSQHRRDT